MNIDIEIQSIKERNACVEADKAWEVSKARTTTIMLITYIAASLLLWVIGADNFLLGALVPTLGYFLSTQSLSGIKKCWVTRYMSEKK